jgi:hypothetical protein
VQAFYRADNYSNADANDRDNAFVLLNGVSLYGGFAGFESSVNNRQYLPLATEGLREVKPCLQVR